MVFNYYTANIVELVGQTHVINYPVHKRFTPNAEIGTFENDLFKKLGKDDWNVV